MDKGLEKDLGDDYARSLLKSVSQIYETQLAEEINSHIRFKEKEKHSWDFTKYANLESISSRLKRTYSGIVVAFVDDLFGVKDMKITFGAADAIGGRVVMLSTVKKQAKDHALWLAHELGHVFSAPHEKNANSIMCLEENTDVFDPLSKKIIGKSITERYASKRATK